jgi:hypothetical protein
MSPSFSFAALLTCVALGLPASAQRGGGHAGAGHETAGRPTAAPTPVPRFGSGLPSFAPPNFRALSPSTAAALRRAPTLANPARFDTRERHFRRNFVPHYGLGVPWPVGWIPDILDYPDPLYPEPAAEPVYGGELAEPAPASVATTEQPAQVPAFRTPYVRTAPVPQEPEDMEPVTLVFKDGRPNEQIWNYMVTRTNLYIHDGRTRVIPIDDIDIAATQKANQESGIDFQVPGRS